MKKAEFEKLITVLNDKFFDGEQRLTNKISVSFNSEMTRTVLAFLAVKKYDLGKLESSGIGDICIKEGVEGRKWLMPKTAQFSNSKENLDDNIADLLSRMS